MILGDFNVHIGLQFKMFMTTDVKMYKQSLQIDDNYILYSTTYVFHLYITRVVYMVYTVAVACMSLLQ